MIRAMILQVAVAVATPIPMPCPEATDWIGQCEILDAGTRAAILEVAAANINDSDECTEALDAIRVVLTAPVWRSAVWRYERNRKDATVGGDEFVGGETIIRDGDGKISLGLAARAFVNTETLARVVIHEAGHMQNPAGGEAHAQRIERACTSTSTTRGTR